MLLFGLVDQTPPMPDSVRQHNHTEFEKKGEAETAGTLEPVGVRLKLLIIGCFGKGRVVADRHYAPVNIEGFR